MAKAVALCQIFARPVLRGAPSIERRRDAGGGGGRADTHLTRLTHVTRDETARCTARRPLRYHVVNLKSVTSVAASSAGTRTNSTLLTYVVL